MQALPELFGLSFLLNLPDRKDRLRAARRELEKAGWQVPVMPAFRFADPAGFPNAGARGCFCSHLHCLQFAQNAGAESILMLEDDLALSPSIKPLTRVIADKLTNWDIIYFGHELTGDIPRAEDRTSDLNLQSFNGNVQCSHFYAVHGRILQPLIARLISLRDGVPGSSEGGPMHYDGALNTFRSENDDIRTLIVNPKLGWQRSSRSDILPGRLDRIRVFRPALDFLRALKNR